MLAIISPARKMKSLDKKDLSLTNPSYLSYTEKIIKELKKLNPWELETVMKINETLAEKTFFEIQSFDLSQKGTAALFSYYGLVYQNINPEIFNKKQLDYVDKHLRILSALYGILKPFDQIFPYRLEMQTKIKINSQNLYDFWNQLIYQQLYQENELIINLASEEYAKMVRKYLHKTNKWIDIEFQLSPQNRFSSFFQPASPKKIPIVWIKMARGQMIHYLVTNQIEDSEELKNFNWNGYQFEPSLSSEKKYVFLKSE